MDTGSKDLISNLPDAIICHILSFLSTKDAALTSVLSKRWLFLLAFVPNLDFDNSIYDHPLMSRQEKIDLRTSFKFFVDRVMALQGNAPLNKFSPRCEDGDSVESHVEGWIKNVYARGVVELDLYIDPLYKYFLPPKALMSKNLVKLKLAGTHEFIIYVGEVFLPKLKTLHLNNVTFYHDNSDDDDDDVETSTAFAKLVSSCLALEELVMVYNWLMLESFSVSNTNLKRFTFVCKNPYVYRETVSFDTPNLLYLEFTDTIAAMYPKVNLESLVEARLCLRMAFDHIESGDDNFPDFFKGLSNVRILYLSSDTLEVLAFYGNAIPVFNNLLHLTIETSQELDWKAMPNLLENCPNLETLVFEGFHYRHTNQCSKVGYRFKDTNNCFAKDGNRCVCKHWYVTPIWLSSSTVKTLKILKFGEISNDIDDRDSQLDLIKYFVETMPRLEEVILYYDTPCDEDLARLSTEFQKLEKVASKKCKFQVISA